jgi:hypothetical protein
MTAEYRRKIGQQTWHFCSNCSHWPRADYVTLKEPPRTHQMCNECICKRDRGECE